MKVADNVFVAMDYRLSVDSGQEVDSSPEGKPLSFITGTGRIIPGLEKAIMGMEVGEESKITLEPEDAYGPVSQDLFQTIPRSKFPADAKIEPGTAFQAQGPRGPSMITVSKVNDDDTVTIDLNHPMAGKQLFFEVKITEVREPLPDEVVQYTSGCDCSSGGQQDGCGSGCSC